MSEDIKDECDRTNNFDEELIEMDNSVLLLDHILLISALYHSICWSKLPPLVLQIIIMKKL